MQKLKEFIEKVLIQFLKKIYNQPFWEKVFKLSLERMNYGNGGDIDQSGELNVFKIIDEAFDKDTKLILFDVGGNVGNYSKALSHFFNRRAIIHSFEPSRKTFEMYLKATSGLQNVISNNVGLSDIESNVLLYSNIEGSSLASIYPRKLDHFGLAMDKKEQITLTTIDSYCTNELIERIHFLKLDIEGHEFNAIQGAKEMLINKRINYIQFEFGGCNIDSRSYFQDFYYLLKDNYRIYRIVKDGLYEIKSYKETYEIFITINYLAVLKQ